MDAVCAPHARMDISARMDATKPAHGLSQLLTTTRPPITRNNTDIPHSKDTHRREDEVLTMDDEERADAFMAFLQDQMECREHPDFGKAGYTGPPGKDERSTTEYLMLNMCWNEMARDFYGLYAGSDSMLGSGKMHELYLRIKSNREKTKGTCPDCGLPLCVHDGSDFCPPGTEEAGGRR